MKQRLIVIALSILLVGCGQTELYSNLSERQANEMVVVLRNAGIDASKTPTDGERWSVRAPHDRFSAAIEVLHAQGYPQDDFASLGQVFKKEGFVSSPLEERARLIYGLSQELSRTISAIDGVVIARVHLAVPEADPLADEPEPSSASVFIKHRSGIDLSAQSGQIKALVVNSVEGLTYDNVTVALFSAQTWPLQQRVIEPTFTTAGLAVAGPVGLGILLLLTAAAHLVWQVRRRRGADDGHSR